MIYDTKYDTLLDYPNSVVLCYTISMFRYFGRLLLDKNNES